MTTSAMTAAEKLVMAQAVHEVISAKIPGWEQGLIPQDVLAEAIDKGVAAIDTLRDKAAAAASPNAS